MDKIVITNTKKISGKVRISGAKNSSLPIIAASLLANGRVTLTNIPHLQDVTSMLHLIGALKVRLIFDEDGNIALDSECIENADLNRIVMESMRASILVLPALLYRFKYAKIYMPGGCTIGERPINLHINALKKLGVNFTQNKDCIIATCKKFSGADIDFEKVTVTGTMNALMVAVLAEGTTIIRNAAKEPEVSDLARFLNAIGAKISGIDTNILVVKGVSSLKGCRYTVISDRIEAGTYLCAAVVLQSKITVENIEPSHMMAILDNLKLAGAKIEIEADTITIEMKGKPKAVNITTAEYPNFPTDMQAQFMVINCFANKPSTINETIFENRFLHAQELNKLGAKIEINGQVASITPVSKLQGTTVQATDLRASACLILAGLIAKGTTVVDNIYHIDRGYECVEEKFHKIGANIRRSI